MDILRYAIMGTAMLLATGVFAWCACAWASDFAKRDHFDVDGFE